MIYRGKKIDFPAEIELNFNPLAMALEQKRDVASGSLKNYYSSVLKQFDANPWLRASFDEDKLKDNPDLLEEIVSTIFPPVLTTNEIKAISTPWRFAPFYQSERLKKMLENAGNGFSLEFMEYKEDEMFIAACTTILAMYYQYPIPKGRPNFIHVPNQKTGKTNCYRATFNADYLSIKKGENALDITEEDFITLIDNYEDISLWKRKFPLGSWTFTGCMIITLVDVNVENIISRITNDLLTGNDESYIKLQQDISELLGTDVTLSFAGLRGTKVYQQNPNFSSLMLGTEKTMDCIDGFCAYAVSELIEKKKFLAIPNIKKFHEHSQSKLSANLLASGLKSYFATPIIYNGENLGFLELGSRIKGALNSTVALRLDEVLPLFAVTGYRMRQEQKNKIEAVIQEEFTTIHPSVKWRFEEEANLFVSAQSIDEEYQLKDLNFKDVYPLYGQLDIRSSSSIRNTAVTNDLLSQLKSAKDLIQLAKAKKSLLIYEELEHVIDQFTANLDHELISSSEQEILRFLNKEFEPTMAHHTKSNPTLQKAFDKYIENLHPELHIIYNERKDFDDSVNSINKSLARYIDEKQEEAQTMFPHYFERYKTDGLEFNIYIGESISPDQGFHISHVNNLRLWQLMVMVEMERMYKKEQAPKKMPLEVASLILAFSNSLSIQFRMDEKRFDVQGAYNARYEIIKKRIDKAHIKGTNERITQAGKMVVVYANDSDEHEYLRYFKFLQRKGYLKNTKPEKLVLENLQGVTGLRALRIGINYGDDQVEKGMTIDEIMKDIEGVGNAN